MLDRIKNFLKMMFFYTPVRNAYFKYYANERNKRALEKMLVEKRKEIVATYGTPFFLNIGSRLFVRKNWRLLDHYSPQTGYEEGEVFSGNLLDYDFDLTTCPRLPITNDSVDLVYTSHCMEHIGDKATSNVFREVYRILKTDGIFRIVLPDIDIAYEAYKKNDIGWFEEQIGKKQGQSIEDYWFGLSFVYWKGKVDAKTLRHDVESLEKEEFFNKYHREITDFTGHNFSTHITWFNKDKVARMLSQSGFTKILPSQPHASVSPEMRSSDFDPNEGMSLYIDAIK